MRVPHGDLFTPLPPFSTFPSPTFLPQDAETEYQCASRTATAMEQVDTLGLYAQSVASKSAFQVG